MSSWTSIRWGCVTFDRAYYGDGVGERFDVLPLLSVFWESGSRPSITLKNRHDVDEAGQCGICVDCANGLCQSVSRDDLEIKTYLPLLEEVLLNHKGGTDGVVLFKRPSNMAISLARNGEFYYRYKNVRNLPPVQ